MAAKLMIWQNYDIEIEPWRDFYKELEGKDKNPTDEEVMKWAEELNMSYLYNERENLNIETEGEIIAIADLGLWDGRRTAYKELGHNIRKVLYTHCDYAQWYCDRYNLKGEMSHHDGTNYILYRELKPDLKYEQEERFFIKLHDGTITKQDISRYTRSLRPYVAKVYGW